MIALIHKKCGAVAYYYDHELVKNENMKAQLAINVDGTSPKTHTQLVCVFCHDKFLSTSDLRQKDLSE